MTCHAARSGDAGSRVLPGALLAGATRRPLYWGGQENDLLRSVNDCRFFFMGAQEPWTVDDEQAKVMYAFLATLPPTPDKAVPFIRKPLVLPTMEELLRQNGTNGHVPVLTIPVQPGQGQPGPVPPVPPVPVPPIGGGGQPT